MFTILFFLLGYRFKLNLSRMSLEDYQSIYGESFRKI